MSGKLTLTKHNGRSGQNGVYNPKHNDRSFDISGSEHIDPERMKQNIYWDWIRGYSDWEDHNPNEDVLDLRFESVEVVKDAVVEETHNADFSVIVHFRDHDLEADRSLSDKGKSVVRRVLDHLMEKFRGMTAAITARLDKIMRDPATKEKHMEPIKEVARKSVLADLHKKQTIVDERRKTHRTNSAEKRHGMEL